MSEYTKPNFCPLCENPESICSCDTAALARSLRNLAMVPPVGYLDRLLNIAADRLEGK